MYDSNRKLAARQTSVRNLRFMYTKKFGWAIVDESNVLPKCGLVGKYYEKSIKFEKHVISNKNFSDDNLNGSLCLLRLMLSRINIILVFYK